MKKVSIFGSTGSIGQNTIKILRNIKDKESFKIICLTARNNVSKLAQDALEFKADYAIIENNEKYKELKNLLYGHKTEALSGYDKIIEMAQMDVCWNMSAIIGSAGLRPTLEIAKRNNTLALANKESVVCAGDLLNKTIQNSKCCLIPVDSEHSAIFQCIQGQNKNEIKKITLTASGGPFRKWTLKMMEKASLSQALCHPNWSMGSKISIDSATMFNKALELIEAKHLFDVDYKKLDIYIHPESVVHSMVTFNDESSLAQMSVPDMCGAIGYSYNYPKRKSLPLKKLNLSKIGKLTFEKPNKNKFPALKIASFVLKSGGIWGTILNASKEIAVEKFIKGEINFLEITSLVDKTLNSREISTISSLTNENLENIIEVDSYVRIITNNLSIKKGK